MLYTLTLFPQEVRLKGLANILRNCSSLTSLEFAGFDENDKTMVITPKELQIIADSLPNLIRLGLTLCEVTDNCFQELTTTLPNLTTLVLLNCKMTDAGISTLFQKCPNITQLQLNGNKGVTGIGFKTIAQSVPKVNILLLSACDITNEGLIEVLQKCPNLNVLQLAASEQVSDISIQAIPNFLPNLINLNLSYCDNINNETIAKLQSQLHACEITR